MENKRPETKLTSEQKGKVIAFCVAALFGIWLFFIPSCKNESDKKEHSKYDALANSHTFVEQKLKSPGSAEFSPLTDKVEQINDSTFKVISFVDSQNGFGALLRTHYFCEIVFTNDGMVQCNNLILQNQ